MAGLILSKIEKQRHSAKTGKTKTFAETSALGLKLNKVYLQLVNIYFSMGDKDVESQ